MKIILFFALLFNIVLSAQDNTNCIIDDETGKLMIVGAFTRSALSDTSFSSWYDSEYSGYEVDLEAIEMLQDKMSDVTFSIVLGTWCSDSRMYVPRFLKILDALDFNDENIFYYGVNRNKEGKENEIDEMDIQFVPTFIVFKNGEEIGRIVENPNESLEKDLAEIIIK